MEFITGAWAFIQAHGVEVLAGLGGLDLFLGVVSKFTPWKWDDNVYSLIHNGIASLAKFLGKK